VVVLEKIPRLRLVALYLNEKRSGSKKEASAFYPKDRCIRLLSSNQSISLKLNLKSMHRDHNIFLSSLSKKEKVVLEFHSKEDGYILKRKCAPMDFGPSRTSNDKIDRYHLWDYESDAKMHNLSLRSEQIISIVPTNEMFDPGEFITWDLKKSPWFYKRDWGIYS
jgi:hypothetical protein